MSDTVKLIIEIDPCIIYAIQNNKGITLGNQIDMCNAIKNGIPLDDVIGKIDKAYDDLDGYDPSALGTFANRVSDILDNIGKAESEVKPNE